MWDVAGLPSVRAPALVKNKTGLKTQAMKWLAGGAHSARMSAERKEEVAGMDCPWDFKAEANFLVISF
jgi:hypothetical protein